MTWGREVFGALKSKPGVREMRRYRFSRSLAHKVRLGRVGLPVWSIILTAMLVAAAAGQAVGPILSGGIQGASGVAVEQAIVLDTDGGTTTTVTGADDFVVTANDEGTSFTAAIELHIGDSPILKLDVDNGSDVSGNAVLELTAPAGLDIAVDETGSDIEEAQMTRTTWLLTVNTGDSDATLDITLSLKDDMQPGFYSISGRIKQVAN